jgi:hypothetical protein
MGVKTKENTMTRISTFCVVSSTLAVLALSANGASAEMPVPKPVTPRITVQAPKPKVISPNAPMNKESGSGGHVGGGSGAGKVSKDGM